MKKMPPIQKIYEAWSAIGDGRVDISMESTPAEGSAQVRSSDGAKTYTVTWSDDATVYTSNDNATFWQLYPGYPVIAVLMLQGKLPLHTPSTIDMAGVNWTAINAAHRRDYAAALENVIEERGLDPMALDRHAQTAYNALEALSLTIRRGRPLKKSPSE